MSNKVKKSNITRANELYRVRSGKVFEWYTEKRAEVAKSGLDYIEFEERGDIRRFELKVRFQTSNAKMQPTEKIAFLIFSIPAVMTCPGATGMCIHNCYARRDERFTTTRASRLSNWLLSMRKDFPELLADAIREAVYNADGSMKKAFRGKKIIVRVHESGDFYSLDYMRKWFKVARLFPDLTFYAFTKSFDILSQCITETPDNFTFRASVWDDTPKTDLRFIATHELPYYTAVTSTAGIPSVNTCVCSVGCGGCGCKCCHKSITAIATEIH